jgi:hypothetical protein
MVIVFEVYNVNAFSEGKCHVPQVREEHRNDDRGSWMFGLPLIGCCEEWRMIS